MGCFSGNKIRDASLPPGCVSEDPNTMDRVGAITMNDWRPVEVVTVTWLHNH